MKFEKAVEEYLSEPCKRSRRPKCRIATSKLTWFIKKIPVSLKDQKTGKVYRYTSKNAEKYPLFKVIYDNYSGVFAGRDIETINTQDVRDLTKHLRNVKGLSDDGIGNYLKYLRALIKYTVKTFKVQMVDKPDIEIFKGDRRKFALSKEQAEILLDHLDPLRADLFKMCLACGQRNSNIRLLKWEYINPAMTEIIIPKKKMKNNTELHLYLNETATKVLKRRKEIYVTLVDAHPTRVYRDFVFIQEKGAHLGRPFSDASSVTNDTWKAAIVRANNFISEKNKRLSEKHHIPLLPRHGVVFHTGRHTFATWHLNAGTQTKELMVAGGWKSLASVIDYQQTQSEQMKKVSKKLDVFF